MRKLALAILSVVPSTLAWGAPPDCCTAPSADYPKVGGNYGNQSHSSLGQITLANIGQLGGAWHDQIEGGSTSAFQQGNVVEAGGVLYAETTQGSVVAVDGATGQEKWRYRSTYGQTLRRGVALGDGKVFTVKGNDHVLALDQGTGAVVWDVDLSGDPSVGSMPTAITFYDGMIYFGTANSKRGVAFALNAKTGATVWKAYGPAGPDDAGHATWPGDSWQTGGAAPWSHPAIDPALGLLYWTFGNARSGAPLDGATREGQNLYANSIVALDLKTGKRAWHFQSVHHDIWDMDNVMAPVLADLTIRGQKKKAVIYGSKTAMVFVLDRKTGVPLNPVDEKPVPQDASQKTWPTQPFVRGDALVDLCPTEKLKAGLTPPHYSAGCLFTPHDNFPVIHFPGTGGGADTSAYSFDPATGLLYVGVGVVGIAQARTGSYIGFRPLGENRSGKVVAYDPARQKVVWSRDNEWSLAHGNGILTTAGGVMFMGYPDGLLVGLDQRDGHEVWRFQTGAGVHTNPIAYTVGGQQYIAVFAGGNALPYNSPKGDHLWAFRVGGTVAQAPAPVPPPHRQPITAAPVQGALVANTVQLGRLWSNGAVGAKESDNQNAMAPQNLHVPVGTTITFQNPADNKADHCATQFFEGLFDSKALKPGQSFSYTFKTRGEFFYNDCTAPGTTGKVVVE